MSSTLHVRAMAVYASSLFDETTLAALHVSACSVGVAHVLKSHHAFFVDELTDVFGFSVTRGGRSGERRKRGKMMLLKKPPSHSWWFDSHNSPRYSLWLQSTVSELDEKTQVMLKLIEEDADSFAQRAEMFYKKRPELVNMVEDFYRAHRSLAERYDQLRSEAGLRIALTPAVSPFSAKQSQKSITSCDRISSFSSDSFESEDSEVDDPEEEAEVGGAAEDEVSNEDGDVKKLTQEVERLKLENRILKAELLERNEEKREAIRQLCLAMDMLKEENASLRKCLRYKKRSVFEFSKWKEVFSGKFFNGNPKPQASIVAL